MKVKAIMFKSNGNEIKESFVSINHWFGSVYHSAPDKEDYNSVKIYVEHNGVFAEIDRCSETSINETTKERIKPMLADLEKFILGLGWINLVHIEFAKQAGLNYEKILNRRREIEIERDNKKQADEILKKEQQEIRNKAYAERMQAIKTDLLNGKLKEADKIIEAINFFKFKVHPRTLGTMYKMGYKGVIGIYSATKTKGMNWNTHSSIIRTVKEFANS